VIENAAADKMGMFSKAAWLTAGLSAAKLAAMIGAPETDKAVSAEDKVRSVILPFGDDAFVIDADGNKRYMYAQIRLDQTAIPLNAAIVAGLEEAEYGTVPSDILSSAAGRINPLTTLFPPSIQAIRAYTGNYDPLRDGPIYQGLKVKPEDEIKNVMRGQPTSPVAQMMGQATGMSPMGLEKSASSLMNTNNFWIQAVGGSMKFLFGEDNAREQTFSYTEMALQNVPGLRSVVKLTTPGIEEMKKLDETNRELNSLYKKSVDGVEELMFKFEQKQVDIKDVETYITAQPEGIRKALADHAKYVYNVDQIMKHFKASEGIPPRTWWASSNALRDEVRAQVFYDQWISADPENRRRMMDVASALQQRGTGYLSQSFRREFAKHQQMLGTEQR
jgi:hypothetical protein